MDETTVKYEVLSMNLHSQKKLVKKIEAIINNQDLSLISYEAHIIRLSAYMKARKKYESMKREFDNFLDNTKIPMQWIGPL